MNVVICIYVNVGVRLFPNILVCLSIILCFQNFTLHFDIHIFIYTEINLQHQSNICIHMYVHIYKVLMGAYSL